MAMIAPRTVVPDPEAGALRITWADGHQSAIPYAALRDHCPCARCKDNRDKHVQHLRMAMATQLSEWKRVGNYALSLSWGDAHDEGLFAYDYLRGLCPCGTCEPVRR